MSFSIKHWSINHVNILRHAEFGSSQIRIVCESHIWSLTNIYMRRVLDCSYDLIDILVYTYASSPSLHHLLWWNWFLLSSFYREILLELSSFSLIHTLASAVLAWEECSVALRYEIKMSHSSQALLLCDIFYLYFRNSILILRNFGLNYEPLFY